MPPSPTIRAEETARPPEPPEVARRIALHPGQAIFLALLTLFVALALFGAFGSTQATAHASGPGLELAVEHPARFRYREVAPIRITLRNTSGRPLDTVRVRLDEAYVSAFSNVTFTPSPQGAWEVVLTDVEPGEVRLISGELQAERYGRHRGTVTVTARGLRPLALDVATFTFP